MKAYIKCSGFKGLLVCIILKQCIHVLERLFIYPGIIIQKYHSLNKFHTTNDVLLFFFFIVKIYSSNIKITFDDLMCKCTDIYAGNKYLRVIEYSLKAKVYIKCKSYRLFFNIHGFFICLCRNKKVSNVYSKSRPDCFKSIKQMGFFIGNLTFRLSIF